MILYADNNASTRVDPAIAARMMHFLTEQYGNPNAAHRFGAAGLLEIENARKSLARLINAQPSEIIFTSGGTESVNAAIYGLLAAQPERRRLIVSRVEHHAVREVAEHCFETAAGRAVEVVWLNVDRHGQPDLDQLSDALSPEDAARTAAVAVMLANNETGVIMPVAEIAKIAHSRGVPVFSDAVNALGKMPVDVAAVGADIVSLSGHKVHAPKGIGALYIRKGTPWLPHVLGGPQEQHRRGGTQNVAGIVGFGMACAQWLECGDAYRESMKAVRDEFERGIAERFPDAEIIGKASPRLPNTTCVCFRGVSAEALLMLLSEAGACASSGSACSSGAIETSPILAAMGIEPELAEGQIRVSWCRESTVDEARRLLDLLEQAVPKAKNVLSMR
jgi:cysteine desulfurase